MNALSLSVEGRPLVFREVVLSFGPEFRTDVFALKNNRSLEDTLAHRRYSHLSERVTQAHQGSLGAALGDFILDLKRRGDSLYRLFLNPYGDATYCDFAIADPVVKRQRGLYAFTVDGALMYIGRCTDSFAKRINQGYGRIHPKNCYRDGQATNCHLNALIAENRGRVSLFVCPMNDLGQIVEVERALIAEHRPPWNIQLKGFPREG